MEQFPQIGDRLIDLSAAPDAARVRDWLGPEAFGQWRSLEGWIDENYPGVFVPEWLNGKKRGWSRRYKKIRAFCTFVPEYRRFSVTIVFGGASMRGSRRGGRNTPRDAALLSTRWIAP